MQSPVSSLIAFTADRCTAVAAGVLLFRPAPRKLCCAQPRGMWSIWKVKKHLAFSNQHSAKEIPLLPLFLCVEKVLPLANANCHLPTALPCRRVSRTVTRQRSQFLLDQRNEICLR